MRILVVNWQDRDNPHAGGAEVHLHEIFGRIVSMGHDVDLLCSGFPGAPATALLDGIHVFRHGSRFTFPLHARRAYHALVRRLAREGAAYDVVIEDLNKMPLWISHWNVPRLVVLTHHLFGATAFREASFPIAALTWLSERPIPWAYRGMPFIAVSQSTAEDLVARGVQAKNITVIYNGVDLVALTPAPGTRADGPVFAYVGRLKRYKRIDLLIRAFARLDHPQARFDIAGKGDDRPRLEQLVAELGLGHRVRFLGFIPDDDKRALYRRAWATMLASPKEGWGISNLESAACGTPVIAADAPGTRESVLHGRTGFLVSGDDPEGYAAVMRRLANDPAEVETLGRQARQFAETLSWDRAARETVAYLQHFAGGPSSWKS